MSQKILVIGKSRDMIDLLIRLIHQLLHCEAIGVEDEKAAIQLLKQQYFHVVLVSSGIKEEAALENNIYACSPNTKVIYHYGGGSGLLKSELVSIL